LPLLGVKTVEMLALSSGQLNGKNENDFMRRRQAVLENDLPMEIVIAVLQTD
jgi:hypothetical protein